MAEAAVSAAGVTSNAFLRESGLYVSTAAAMLRAIGAGAPEVLRAATAAVARRGGGAPGEGDGHVRLDAEAFAGCPEVALDALVAESPGEAAVVPAETDLLELGGWAELWRISPKDPLGNVALGDVLLESAEGCYVRSEETLTAVVGLKDAVVVATGDAVLAMHRDLAPSLGEVVRRLRRLGRPEVAAHRRTIRPWGSDEGLLSQEGYQVRRIQVRPGGAVGPLRHAHRAGHWVVVHGSALVTRDGVPALLHENEAIHLPLGCEYRLENPGRIALTLIEVRVGAYLGEDDILAAPSREGHAGA
jgi:mannose-1-phosphate guanylyltransferase/mannose-6-phosphate isomerase